MGTWRSQTFAARTTRFLLSKPTEGDIAQIAQNTIEQFGIEQARAYRDLLITSFQTIADNPNLGKAIDDIGKGIGAMTLNLIPSSTRLTARIF